MNLKTMPKKHLPNPKKYEFLETNYVMGIPFPRLPETIDPQFVPLKEDYKMRSMDYLDTPEARPLFEKQADLIIENGWKGIIDVGCRHGPVNDILHERGYTDYEYMGFDTSTQPIEYAQETWQEFGNIEYRILSWKDFKPLGKRGQNNKKETVAEWWERAGQEFQVSFPVDVIIWSGVLLYEPIYHLWYFHNMHKSYGAQNAIIQEPLKDQRPECWREDLELNTIANKLDKYKTKYNEYDSWEFDLDIFSGRRIVSRVKLWKDDDSKWVDWDNDFAQLTKTPRSTILPCGYKVIPYIFGRDVNWNISFDDKLLCEKAMLYLEDERINHRLSENYTDKGLHFDKMYLYNFVFDGTEPVFCSGAQEVNDLGIRVFSRYFSFDKYKTDGTKLLDKNDNFEELEWTLEQLRGKIVFWSRDKSPKFFEKLKEDIPIFKNWIVHDEKINIIYPDNKQYVFYTPKLPAEWWKAGSYGALNEILCHRN